MLKKRVDVFPTKFSFCLFIVAVLLACFSINKGVASSNPAKHLSKVNQAVENHSSSNLWVYKNKNLHPDPALCIYIIEKSTSEKPGEYASLCSGGFNERV
jgi:hypothetical protein